MRRVAIPRLEHALALVEEDEDDRADSGRGYTRRVFDYLVKERICFYEGAGPGKSTLRSQYPPLQKTSQGLGGVAEQLIPLADAALDP